MLELEDVHSFYGDSHVLHGVSLGLRDGQVASLLGRNGAGKTTTVVSIMGYVRPRRGRIIYDGHDLTSLPPHAIARLGLGFVPQERRIFPSLTVRENLTVAARPGRHAGRKRWTLGEIHKLFPRLEERSANLGFQLSGGEQQMLAIARALMLNPSLLLLDEPLEGLAPLVVREIMQVIATLKNEGLSILLIEQNLKAVLALADAHHVLTKGVVIFRGLAHELANNDAIIRDHLAV